MISQKINIAFITRADSVLIVAQQIQLFSTLHSICKMLSSKCCLLFLVSSFFTLLKSLTAFEYIDCGSALGAFSNVSMTLCVDAENLPYCPMKRGSTGTLEIDFKSIQYSHTLSAVVHGIIAGVKFPVHLPNKDGCYNSNVQCPVEMLKPYKYKTTLPILNSYVKVGLEIQWELQDDASANIVCVKFPARIVD